MSDAARELQLLLEALEEGRVGGEGLGPEELERHDLVELTVAGAVDDAHAALAERAEDLVAAGEHLPAAEDGPGCGCPGGRRRDRRRVPGHVRRRRRAPGRRRGRGGGLPHRGHAVAQEGDHLVLLAQVGEEPVERAGEDADLVAALDRDRSGVGALADPLDQRHQLPHRAGDPGGGAPGGEEPEGHDPEGDEDEAVAELAEGGGLRGEAAQGEGGPDLLAGRCLQRDAHADVAVAVEVDLEGRPVRTGELRPRHGGGQGGLARAQGGHGEPRRLPGGLDEEGDLAVGQLPDLGGDRLVETVAGHQHAHELGPRLHGHRHRGEELLALAPQRRRVLSLERPLHHRVSRQVVARGRGAIGAGHQRAGGVGRHHEVGGEVLAALAERVEGGGLVALGEGGLEVGVVGEDAHPELELVEAVGLDRLPDVARLLETRVDRGPRQPVGLHRGEGERAAHEQHHQRGDEQQDLPGQSHRAPRSSSQYLSPDS